MASELWIEELKMRAEKAVTFNPPGDKMQVGAQAVLELIKLVKETTPPGALIQCQEREEDLKQEVEELEHEVWTLRHENEALSMRCDELEEQADRLLKS